MKTDPILGGPGAAVAKPPAGHRSVGGSIVYAVLIIMGVLWVLPVWWTLSVATKSVSDFYATPFYDLPREFNLFANIATAWTSAGLGDGFINSILYGVVGSALAILLASLASYAISVLRLRGGFTLFLVIFSVTVFPLQMYMIPLFRMYTSIGLYDTRFGMIIFYTAVSIPFCTLVLRGFYSTVPREYREAALVGGAGELRVLWSVYAPLSWSAALVLFLFQFTWIWNDLLFGLVLSTSPSVRPVMPSLDGLMGVYGASSMPVVLAGTVVTALPTVVLFFGLRRHFTRGLTLVARAGKA